MIAEPVAVVSGGTKGIGLALSERLVKLGHRVVALYRCDWRAAESAAAELGLHVHPVDVGDPDAVAALADTVLAEYGTPRVLVNNAGRNIDRPFLELTAEDWRAVLDTNLSGAFYLSKAFAPAMLAAQGDAVIVNIGATTGIRPRRDGANYCASKAGLLQLTKCLALELAPKIRVNCLIPGMTATEELTRPVPADRSGRAGSRSWTGIPLDRIGVHERHRRRAGLPDQPRQRLSDRPEADRRRRAVHCRAWTACPRRSSGPVHRRRRRPYGQR